MRLCSWNVLADSYVRASYYPRSDPALLKPGARAQAILDAIVASPANVVCLQEVEHAFVDAARSRLTGWQISYEPKRGKPDGCAILARPGTNVEDVGAIVFADGAPD
ncbi:MAG TPA: endonuclease/exonuclease/phosphatase family protein [Kofleriaceae bacterium]|nr:endonuclease/exonuclease/phosphatase family protein [Kofleriaceae bacterium]